MGDFCLDTLVRGALSVAFGVLTEEAQEVQVFLRNKCLPCGTWLLGNSAVCARLHIHLQQSLLGLPMIVRFSLKFYWLVAH